METNLSPIQGITKKRLDQVLSALPDTSRQQKRFIEYLALTPERDKRYTVFCNRAVSAKHLSHLAREANPILYSFGLYIGCERPPIPPLNKFSESSQMYIWSLYELPGVANDLVYWGGDDAISSTET